MIRLFFLVVLLSFPVIASAQLTSDDIRYAVMYGLIDYAEFSYSYDPEAIATTPIDRDTGATIGELFDYYISGGSSSGDRLSDRVVQVDGSVRALGSAVSNVVSVVGQFKAAFDRQIDVPLSYVNTGVSAVAQYASDIAGMMAYLRGDLSTQSSILTGLRSDLSNLLGTLSTNNTELSDSLNGMSDALDDLNSNFSSVESTVITISSTLDDSYGKLYEIANATQDTADSAGQIVNWLEWQLDQVLISAIASGVASLGPISVDVTSVSSNALPDTFSIDGMSDLLSAVSGIGGNLSAALPEIATTASNTTAIAGTLDSFFDAATNFYAAATFSPDDIDAGVATTNLVTLSNAVDTANADSISNDWDAVVSDADVPPVEDPYRPTIPDSSSDPLDQSSVSTDVRHGTTIMLSRGDSGYHVPRMEIDLHGNAGVSSFISRFSAIFRIFWASLFSIWMCVLYFQTYRKLRSMFVAARGAGSGGANVDVKFLTDNGDLI